jgi:hypothetical protein
MIKNQMIQNIAQYEKIQGGIKKRNNKPNDWYFPTSKVNRTVN